jgi:hypothetical protein
MESAATPFHKDQVFERLGVHIAFNPTAVPVVVLSHDYWTRRFGRDPDRMTGGWKSAAY